MEVKNKTAPVTGQQDQNAISLDLMNRMKLLGMGQMSAWYILASAGFHPLCPSETRYELTAPVFDRVEIALDRRYAKGRKFVVTTEGNAPDACYIQSATLNCKPYNRCYIDHEDIVRGGELHFVLGRTPHKQWGVE